MLTKPQGTSLGRLAELAHERLGDYSTLRYDSPSGEIDLTIGELASQACRLSGGLASLGVRCGDRVVVCMANCPEVLECYQAVWRLGAAVTPLLFLLSVDELRYAITSAEARVVVTTPDLLAKVREATEGLGVRLVVTGGVAAGAMSYDYLASFREAPLADVDSTEMAALLFTGGTTGRAKGVVLSHDALSTAAWASVRRGEEPVDVGHRVSLLPLPLAHVFGLMVSTMSMHAVHPSRTVLMQWFDPARWVALAEEERVQAGAVVPTMVRLLLAQPLESHDLSALERLSSGSAPLPAETVDEWERRMPGCELVEGYGCSETAAMATATPYGGVRRGSVGTAPPEVSLRIERPDGSEAATGEDGEVVLRTPSLMTGYWRDPEATTAVMHDGWFRTGDVGHVEADGYLFLVDRLKDVIIRNGFNVYPRDVEEALLRHPAVAVCGVVGRPDPERGEEVVAYVQLTPGAFATPEELVAFGRDHLSRAKYPREVHVLDQVPLTSMGKLDRKALRSRG